MFFLLHVGENGIPDKMVGPLSYEEAERLGLEFIKQANKDENQQTTQTEIDMWEMDGSMSFSNGGGLYIVQSESQE